MMMMMQRKLEPDGLLMRRKRLLPHNGPAVTGFALERGIGARDLDAAAVGVGSVGSVGSVDDVLLLLLVLFVGASATIITTTTSSTTTSRE